MTTNAGNYVLNESFAKYSSLELVHGRIALLYPTVPNRNDIEPCLNEHIKQIIYIAQAALQAARASLIMRYNVNIVESYVLAEAHDIVLARVTEGLARWSTLRDVATITNHDVQERCSYVVPSHEEIMALKVLHSDNMVDSSVEKLLQGSKYEYLLQPKPMKRHYPGDSEYATENKGGLLQEPTAPNVQPTTEEPQSTSEATEITTDVPRNDKGKGRADNVGSEDDDLVDAIQKLQMMTETCIEFNKNAREMLERQAIIVESRLFRNTLAAPSLIVTSSSDTSLPDESEPPTTSF
ncbi:hypothetical protein SEUCBS140593_003041 [Sporothrix eucalyptigena]|uniref:Uncharacterized protein n=1 Tax=Sporothrix eucalyptigena TaxID=1812306 RepID=A0ABP0BBF7_9PEZI